MNLTRPESFLLTRRRMGLSQAEMSEGLGVALRCYSQLEGGRPEWGTTLELDTPAMFELQPLEKCLILRRRKKLSQSQLAALLGCSRVWVFRMEKGLAAYDLIRKHFRV